MFTHRHVTITFLLPFKHSVELDNGQLLNPHQADVSESLICPTKEIRHIGYIFAFYATKMGSMDSGDTKVHTHWV